MHTPLEFYVELPEDLFRLGRKNKAKLDYIRTTPPRQEDEKWDIQLIKRDDNYYVDSKSGGLSLFNYRDPKLGNLWWKIPKGTKLLKACVSLLIKGGKTGRVTIPCVRFITCSIRNTWRNSENWNGLPIDASRCEKFKWG